MKKLIITTLVLALVLGMFSLVTAKNKNKGKCKGKLYVFGSGSILSGFNIYDDRTNTKIGYAACCDGDGNFKLTLRLRVVPVYLDDGEIPPDPWKPDKDNVYDNCQTCHREPEMKHLFENWDDSPKDGGINMPGPEDVGHWQHYKEDIIAIECTQCHRRL